ncbi:MAG: hypothetical protein JW852_03290, partial [Spirochaetales bacterium]|nr:hypothetical protein [Spirochaetales bacterium]
MKKAKKTFKGGYRFSRFKGAPSETIESLEAPDTVILPLYRGPDGSIEASVKVGDEVRAGQSVGTGPVHSPVDGTVSSITRAPAVIIEKKPGYAFGKNDVLKLGGATADWRKFNAASIEGYIYNAGAASLDAAGIPTRYANSSVNPDEIEHLIVRIVADELLPAADTVLLPESGIESFLEGLRMLEKVFSHATVTIAVSINQPELLDGLQGHLLSDDKISLLPVSDKYPQGFQEILVPAVTGREFPYGYDAVNMGVIILSPQTV